jgi:glycosyltransferase involved in cell wall biosynthesis
VDGLLACGAPDELEAAAAAGCPAWILLHMPLAGHGDLERRALQAAAGVICTSSTAAARLRARHGTRGIQAARLHVALPGTDAAPVAPGSDPPHLVAVAALLPNKDQLLLLGALARLTDLPWTAVLAGSDSADPSYAEQVRNAVARLGLTDRVRVPGELRGDALAGEWNRADLSLLISQAETYGMVVTESLARGIPVVVRDGTGAVEALGAGAGGTMGSGDTVDDGDGAEPALPGTAVGLDAGPAPLAAVLRRWLTEPELRARWRTAALEARGRLPGWDVAARTVLGILGQHVDGTDAPGDRNAGRQERRG